MFMSTLSHHLRKLGRSDHQQRTGEAGGGQGGRHCSGSTGEAGSGQGHCSRSVSSASRSNVLIGCSSGKSAGWARQRAMLGSAVSGRACMQSATFCGETVGYRLWDRWRAQHRWWVVVRTWPSVCSSSGLRIRNERSSIAWPQTATHVPQSTTPATRSAVNKLQRQSDGRSIEMRGQEVQAGSLTLCGD